ncbi:hypothetical protein TWF506_011122 [Arthrobotrys conoides]|uniref:Uncharacterized protein n=1 Tax=Arthrobotrys conoides TaxID=74498 RepID=A0AAN8PAD0_9PEZI
MRRLVPLFIPIILPAVVNAYSYAFLRAKGEKLDAHTVRHYNEPEPQSCQRITHSPKFGWASGIRLWTNQDLGRGPWAFIFYADSAWCDEHGNIPVLVMYCNKPTRSPYTLQIADFEPLAALMKDSTTIWDLRSWEEIQPGTIKWRLFIEDLNLVPGQIAYDSGGRWGDTLAPVNPEIARVKMWATPMDRFDRPQSVLKDDQAMEEILGEDVGFNKYSKGIDEAPFLTRQPTTEKWARIFGIGDIDSGEFVGRNLRARVGQPLTEKWANILDVKDVAPEGIEGEDEWGGDMEFEGGSEEGEWSVREGEVPRDPKIEDEVLSESVRPENGSQDDRIPVEIKIENNEVGWSSNEEQDLGVQNTLPPKIPAIEEKNEEPIDTKEEPFSTVGQRAQSTVLEPVGKIETTSEPVEEGNQYPQPEPEPVDVQEINSEQQSNFQSGMEEEEHQYIDVDSQSILSDLIGVRPSRPSREFTSIPLHNIPGFGEVIHGFSIGLSDHLQRQYAIADQGIRELGRGKWDWQNKRQMKAIIDELTSTVDERKATAEKRRRKLPRRKKTQAPLADRLMYQIAADNGEEQEFESLIEDMSSRADIRRSRNQKKSQQDIVDLLVPASKGRGKKNKPN